jgi:hypothetical protein
MKKQILILVFLVLATFASVTNSYAQPGHLTPTPGTLYNYLPTVTSAGGSAPVYLWHVTDASVSSDLIGGAQLATGTYFAVGGTGFNAASIDLTWTAAAVNKTFYLVLMYSETSPLTGCAVTNMKSYEIKPASTLLLAVTRVNFDGSANLNTTICAPTIFSATVTSGSPSTVTYLYNKTVVYYKVNASGMDGTFRPALHLLPLPGAAVNGQNYASIKIAKTASPILTDYAAFPGTITDIITVPGMFSTTATDDLPVTVAGKDYFIEVTIDNARYEGLLPLTMTLAADGFLPIAYSISDIVGGGNYGQALAFAKSDTYTILARPAIAPAVTIPASPFINQVP